MSNDIKIFENNEFGQVRIVMRDEEPWFVAKDVCEVLGLGNSHSSLALLDDDEKGVHSMDTLGGKQEMAIVSESGLYSLILRSRKPEAKPFRRWLTHDVIPSIRKTGGYGTPALSREDEISIALRVMGETNAALVLRLEAIEAKADFADAVSVGDGGMSLNGFAKVLRQAGIKDMGPNRLYRELRKDGFVIHRRGKNWNLPRQRYVDKGWFRIIEYLTPGDDSIQCVVTDFAITGTGQQALLRFYKDKYGISRQLSLFDGNRNGRAKVIPMHNRNELARFGTGR